jgi:hypothetical protein
VIRRPKFRAISLVASSSLVALMLLVPAGASAATPTVSLTGPTAGTPGTVSPGETVAFSVSLTNQDSSTISQLSLTTNDPTLTVASATSADGKCATTSPLSCAFRNLKFGTTVSAFVVLNAKNANFGVQFRWDTTGQAGDKGGNSHGDSFYWPYSGVTTTPGTPIAVGVNGDTTNYRSRYVLTKTQQQVFNNQSINSTNKQSTQVNAPNTGIPVTVQDGPGGPACPASVVCFGEASVIEVNGGQPFPGGFQVILQFDSSEIPGGVNANNIQIYHTWDGPPAPGFETIPTRCTFSGGVPTSLPCLTAKKINGNDLQVTIWTTHNGVIHGLG